MNELLSSTLFITSPLVVFWPSGLAYRAIELTRQQRYARISRPVLDVLWKFLEPLAPQVAISEGCSQDAIVVAIKEGLILPADSERFLSAKLWEDHGWTRAAFATFSQLNLSYAEENASEEPLAQLTEQRRVAMSQYLTTGQYPERALHDHLMIVELPVVQANRLPDFDSLFARRSARRFSSAAVSLEAFAGVFYEATENVRKAEESRRSGDPYFLLNSFYSWLTVYVAVQGVEGLDRGVYQYDPVLHQLRCLRRSVTNEEIAACIQHQNWIGGAGFCVFISVQWERYYWIYRHARAYLNLIIQLGEIGQEFLMSAYSRRLAGWMTPAVTESAAAGLLGLDLSTEEALYFLKLGPPREEGSKASYG